MHNAPLMSLIWAAGLVIYVDNLQVNLQPPGARVQHRPDRRQFNLDSLQRNENKQMNQISVICTGTSNHQTRPRLHWIVQCGTRPRLPTDQCLRTVRCILEARPTVPAILEEPLRDQKG